MKTTPSLFAVALALLLTFSVLAVQPAQAAGVYDNDDNNDDALEPDEPSATRPLWMGVSFGVGQGRSMALFSDAKWNTHWLSFTLVGASFETRRERVLSTLDAELLIRTRIEEYATNTQWLVAYGVEMFNKPPGRFFSGEINFCFSVFLTADIGADWYLETDYDGYSDLRLAMGVRLGMRFYVERRVALEVGLRGWTNFGLAEWYIPFGLKFLFTPF